MCSSRGRSSLRPVNRVWKARARLGACRGSKANDLLMLQRDEEAIELKRKVLQFYESLGDKRLALKEALHLSAMMSANHRYAEAAEFLREKVSEARALLGPRDKLTLTFREMRCMNIVWDPEANAAAVRGILPELEDLCRVTRQVYGATHPGFLACQNYLKCARGRLAGQPCMTKRGGTYTLIPAVRE